MQTGITEGVAEDFYGFNDQMRMELIQAILINSLPEQAILQDRASRRKTLDEEDAMALLAARFGNDRIGLAEMLHEISGHRRVDLARMLQDDGGEALIVYLYHIGMSEDQALSMLLHGPDAASHSYAKVAQLMTLYDQLYPLAAERIVLQLFGPVRTSSPVLKPVQSGGMGTTAPRYRQTGLATRTPRDTGHGEGHAFGRRHGLQERDAG